MHNFPRLCFKAKLPIAFGLSHSFFAEMLPLLKIAFFTSLVVAGVVLVVTALNEQGQFHEQPQMHKESETKETLYEQPIDTEDDDLSIETSTSLRQRKRKGSEESWSEVSAPLSDTTEEFEEL